MSLDPNLSMGETFIEGFMTDECLITRDPEGGGDDDYDWNTGEITPPTPDFVTIYSGKCNYKWINARDLEFEIQGQDEFRKVYKVMVPIDVDNLKVGDVFQLTSVRRDELLLGIPMRVAQVVGSTNYTYRQFYAEHYSTDDSKVV